jgi:hypothetical protein
MAMMATGGVALLAGCGEMFPSKFRFRMTVEVETPQGLRSGSSVMEISAANATIKLPESHAVEIGFKAEAVPVDLPGGTLFALVGMTARGDTLVGEIVTALNPDTGLGAKFVQAVAKLGRSSSVGHAAVMASVHYPRLVRFRDIRDPKTVELVDPADLAKSFGPGVRLKRIMLTVVDEPVTTGLENRLQNIGILPNWSLDNDFEMTENPTLAQQLGYSDFSKGFNK